MTKLLAIAIEPALASHVAVALRRHRKALRERGIDEPDGLADLEAFAVEVVTSTQQASQGVNVDADRDDGSDDTREYLTRTDVHRLTGASLATVDRWIASGRLRSCRRGRVRRVKREDLDEFLSAA